MRATKFLLINWLLIIRKINTSTCNDFNIIGERAKRARRYLVMFMEVRDIYIYVRLFLIRMCALSVLRIKFKS